MTSNTDERTVIVGAGPAGLTAALALARYRHPVVVLDSPNAPRNGASSGVHGHVGMDGISPLEFRARAWNELSRYATVELRQVHVESVRINTHGRFRVKLGNDDVLEAASVLLAAGVVDIYPDVEGFAACWGHSVIHCPFCLGDKNADRRWGLVTDNVDLAAMSAVALRAWSIHTIAICPGSAPGVDAARPAARGMGGDIVAGTIHRLLHREESLYGVEFDDGRVLELDTLVWTPAQRPQDVIARAVSELNLSVQEGGFLTVDDNQRTNVPGLYAAGDLASRWKQSITTSAAAGAVAADAIHSLTVQSAFARSAASASKDDDSDW